MKRPGLKTGPLFLPQPVKFGIVKLGIDNLNIVC